MTIRTEVPQMTWHVPPGLAGQMIEVAYASSRDGQVWRRTIDRTEGPAAEEQAVYEVANAADCGCDHECDCWQPWNAEPTGYDWREVRWTGHDWQYAEVQS